MFVLITTNRAESRSREHPSVMCGGVGLEGSDFRSFGPLVNTVRAAMHRRAGRVAVCVARCFAWRGSACNSLGFAAIGVVLRGAILLEIGSLL